MNLEYLHSEDWRVRGEGYLVEVHRHIGVIDLDHGPYRWALYAYIYPDHALFKKLDVSMRLSEVPNLNLYGGCSYFSAFWQYDRVVSFKVGCDFNHLHDQRFSYMIDKEQATEVFECAEKLFDLLKGMKHG